jgi:hypothetical protein
MVRRSHVLIKFNPVSAEEMKRLPTVTGTINVTNYTVFVNGTRATMNPDMTWVAKEVRIPYTGPAFMGVALPNSELTNAAALPQKPTSYYNHPYNQIGRGKIPTLNLPFRPEVPAPRAVPRKE